jgi:triosephosphate isomerase
LEQQLLESLANNTNSEKLIVAYEPIWAIGTGLIPEVSEISKIHDFLRVRLVELYGSNASTIPLLYGGSVNGSNASEIFNVNNVNGALVGGASLSFEKFAPIIRAIENTGP